MRHFRGLTLVELVVVLVVAGVLSTLAVAGYGQVVQRSRAEAVATNLLTTVGLSATSLHLLGDPWSSALSATAADTGGPLPGADGATWVVLAEGDVPTAVGELGWAADGTLLALTALASPGDPVAVVLDNSALVAIDLESDGDPAAALAAVTP
jgi:prepilin-type N-terminal cleavage/methylation domain-containing protein